MISTLRKPREARWIPLVIICLSAFFIPGCITKPFLKKGQLLLVNQRVKGNKSIKHEELEPLFRQKANRKLLGTTPYLAFYFFGKTIWDTNRVKRQIASKEAYYNHKIKELGTGNIKDSVNLEVKKEKKTRRLYTNLREGNWWMRVVGEPPAIYDTAQSAETLRELRSFYFNHGFFDNEIHLKEDTFIDGNISVKYIVKENKVHRIRSVEYRTDDYRLKQLIDSSKNASLLRVNAPYKKGNITEERERVERLFRNKGYFTFSRDYIKFTIDTGFTEPKTKADSLLQQTRPFLFNRFGCGIVLEIQSPEKGRHTAYVVDSVHFSLNESDRIEEEDEKKEVKYKNINYSMSKRRNYSLDVLDRKVLIHPNQFFNASLITNTQAQLSGMDMFRYVNLALDTQGTKMRMYLKVNRLPKYQISDELGFLMSQGAPGPYINIGFKIRNLLGGFEVFEINGRYSEEGQISPFISSDVVFRARDLSISSSFTISKILLPFALGQQLNRFNPKTRYIFNMTALTRPEYERNLIKGALNYSILLSPNNQIGISPTDVTVNITPSTSLNKNYLEQLVKYSGLGESVKQSFRQAVVTNFNAYYMYNENFGGQKKKSKYFRVNYEFGGQMLYLVQKYGLNLNHDSIGKFKTFRYTRIQADFRFYKPTSKNTIVAFRLMGGMAIPIGASSVLPWEKYFFSGGSNSIRAWSPRRLGPGSYAPENSDPNNLTTEQPGELILESSIEIRQKLIGFLEGAVFADAGNVWNLKKDLNRPGAEINPLFLRQLALGGGFGIRFDFSFLIIRVDVATKLYNPAFSSEKERWQIKNISFSKPFGVKGQTLVNLGIGYPF